MRALLSFPRPSPNEDEQAQSDVVHVAQDVPFKDEFDSDSDDDKPLARRKKLVC